MSAPEDYAYIVWKDRKSSSTILKKAQAQEYVNAYYAKEHPGSVPPQIEEGKEFTGRLARYKTPYTFKVKKISSK